MRNRVNTTIRLFEMIAVLGGYSWDYLFKCRGINRTAQRAVLLRKSIEKLGSVFIKLGQMLSLRPDYLSDEYCNELYKLLDKVPPFSQEYVVKIIKQELNSDINGLFRNFEIHPVASASFSQVHKATTRDGAIVAVKIQRPGIENKVRSDISILRKVAWLVDLIFHPANKFTKIVDDFESWTNDELNYKLEADYIEKFNKFERVVNDEIRGPKVYSELSTTRILTMEFVEGYSLAQIIQANRDKNQKIQKEITARGFNGENIVSKLIRNTLEMTHLHGFFHADPHPANIIFNKKGEIIFIDFGIVGTLSKKERLLILRYLRSMLTGNQENAFKALIGLCTEYSEENIEKVKREYYRITKKLNETFDATTYLEQQKKSGPILVEALSLLQKNEFVVPIGIVRYFKAFETIEGLIFSLYPNLQVKNMAKEFRRISIISLVDAIPTAIEENGVNDIILKLINSLEESLLFKE